MISVPVYSLESEFPSVTPPLTPGEPAVVTFVLPGAGTARSVLEPAPAPMSDPLVAPTARLHAGGAMLEVRLTETCADAAGEEVTVEVHQVVEDATAVQAAIEDETLVCGADGNLAPVLIAPVKHPWVATSALVVVSPADCGFPCEPPAAVVAVEPATADPVPTATGVDIRIISATRHLDGAFARVTVGVRCDTARDFFVTDAEARQVDGSGTRTAFGQVVAPCVATERVHPILLTAGDSADFLAAETDLPLFTGETFIQAFTPSFVGNAAAGRTVNLADGPPLDQPAADADLAGAPRIRAGGAVLEAQIGLAACDPDSHFLVLVEGTQVSGAGRVHGGDGEELRFACDGGPQEVLVHLHASGDASWHAGPAVLHAFGQVCKLDFSSCREVDARFIRTVVLTSPGT